MKRSGSCANKCTVLGMLSKAIATVVTQPMIVAKIGLQSRPPPSRKGKPFTSIAEVISYILMNEGWRRLFKGLGPQLSKAILFQGILMLVKERLVASKRLSNNAAANQCNNRIRNRFALLYFLVNRTRPSKLREPALMRMTMPVLFK